MSQLPSAARYLLREIIPRALLLTVTFKWLMPLTSLFHFDGGWLAAGGFALAFTGMFWFFGGYIAGLPSVKRFLTANEKRWWLPVMNIGLVFVIPAAALCLAALAVPPLFSLSWLWGPPAGSIILNAACAATHDWGAGESSTDLEGSSDQ